MAQFNRPHRQIDRRTDKTDRQTDGLHGYNRVVFYTCVAVLC